MLFLIWQWFFKLCSYLQCGISRAHTIFLPFQVSRISNELSKPEYLPLLKKISEGNLGSKNSEVLKSLIYGPETRRYIKPHRCNHQSKLAKVYGSGPKWIICTGYLNLNTPSLYDWSFCWWFFPLRVYEIMNHFAQPVGKT